MTLNQEINTYTVTSVLSACAGPLLCKEAFQIHCRVHITGLYSDPMVKNSLMNLYSKIGAIKLGDGDWVVEGEGQVVSNGVIGGVGGG
ncbi:hypothetical protein Hanom_Chr04g00362161 [Helianthus anomalus]